MIANKSKQFFSNSISHAFFNPSYLTRFYLFRGISDMAPHLGGKLIDLGCGTKPYKRLFSKCTEYLGVDIEVSGNSEVKNEIDIYYDGNNIPLESSSVDSVFSSETFEHIFNLDEVVEEIYRILKPQGKLLVTCPFIWPEHEKPYDYARYTSFGIKHILEKKGFDIIEYKKTGSYLSSMLQMLALYIYFFINKIPLLSYILFVIMVTPLFLLAQIMDFILPKKILRDDVYLNNIILAKKK